MLLRILDRFEEILISVLMALAVILIFVAVVHRFSLGIAADLVGWARANDMETLQAMARSSFRWINSLKLTWAQEACIYLFVWMAKFGAAYGVRIGIHVGVDLLVNKLEGRSKKIMTIIAMSGGILFTAIVTWIGTKFVWHTYLGGQISADLEIKMWLVYLAVPLGSALMCFRFIQALRLYLTTGYIAHHDIGEIEGIEENADIAAEGKA
ncbi:C4-dicarboxylate ABC transporter substrate-binding protein [Haematobacter missouriensis]|uniref:TRAP transporter small permease protein n=1 Tax=Haematobacter missouriensis TaxID=366616 RepID=A0A212AQK8_9RHOB|nr:TRAP transporter small permease [Haematobacter missouriensis]KFI25858.1 C4-dicarboxylate ABC transporter substrate-binding protein [Haematobacter missouriensis]OWJ77080.1 TRAP transporter small permease [Haematobacter missouriensis]OWJ83749.1 TRAP transporter small permease [Haematobacter missouriensis]